jgi:cobalt transporter subunit CbtA
MLTRVFGAACIAGLVAGLLLAALQQWQVVPLLRAAEVFEAHAEQARVPSDSVPAADSHAFGGWESAATLAVTNIVLGVGFALILAGVAALHGSEGWRAGALWGLAGYVEFFVAPSLGQPPTLPGVPAASLGARTSWWLLAVACSAGGLWLIVFARPLSLRALGVLLLFVPHVVGAPRPDVPSTFVPVELSGVFIRATYVTNAVFWVLLGALVGVGQKVPLQHAEGRSDPTVRIEK